MNTPTLKTSHLFSHQLAAALLLAAVGLYPSSARAQGSLTPPGSPVPTMKSLDQVYAKLDARTAITNANSTYLISTPGSYYLTTNLTVSSGPGVSINVSGVTLDLNGFTISSTANPASYQGVALNGIPAVNDVTIVNGHIRGGVTNNGSGGYGGSGFAAGVSFTGNAPTNAIVARLSISGVASDGIRLGLGNATVVEACTVATAGGSGITASTVRGSVAVDCNSGAVLGDQVSDCRGIANNGNGVTAAATALNCYGSSSSAYGVSAAVAQNCYGQSSTSTGLFATTALNCRGASTGGTGLNASMANSCYGTSATGTGLSASYGNFCFGSTVSVTTKYNMP